jgi:hypothetical protein
VVLGSLALSSPARGGGALVALVRPQGASALVTDATARLSAELGAAGFSVRIVEGSGGADARAEVERVEGSFATISIVALARGAAADVWIADRVTGKTVVRRVDVADPGAATAASDLAVRSVELLRASLLEIHEQPPPRRALPEEIARFAGPRAPPAPAATPHAAPPTVSPPPPPALAAGASRAARASPAAPPPEPSPPAAPPATPGPRASLEVAAALLASSEGGAAPLALLRLSLSLPRRLSLRLSAAPAATALTLAAPQGTVEVRQWLAGLELAYAFTPEEARLRPMVALGGGVYGLRVDGSALAGYVGEHNEAASGFVAAGAGLGVRVTEGIVALADVETLVLLPGRAVTAVGTPLAHLGRPAFLPALGLVTSF